MGQSKTIRGLNFDLVGVFDHDSVSEDRIRYVEFNREFLQEEGRIYAFVISGQVKYIGKTVRTLKQRLSGYLTPGPSQTTNIRINALIRDAATKFGFVEIYSYLPVMNVSLGDLEFGVLSSLEEALVKEINPDWNIAGRG